VDRVGHYEIQGEIARGGMGIVYRALDTRTQQPVAAKVMLDPTPDPRFQQEVRSLARLQHPAIVSFLELTQDDAGRDVVIMELVEGESLRARLRRDGPFPLDEALGLTLQLCEAVGYAHERGVLHRDLKPDNVLVTADGEVKLTDFGLGKVVDQTLAQSVASLTQDGEILGTPSYMPPEQATGDKAAMGPRSDVYALGATLYALVTGKAPFAGLSLINILNAVLNDPPPRPSDARPEVSPVLDAVVLRCLAKEPGQRYASAAELASALRAAGLPDAAARSNGHGRAAAALVALGLAVAAGAVAARSQAESASVSPTPAVPPPSTTTTPAPSQDPSAAAEAAFERGAALGRELRWPEALEALNEAVRLAPNRDTYHMLRGRARLELGEYQGALEDIETAMRLAPGADDAYHFFRGQARHWLGDLDGALADFDRTLEQHPSFAEAYYRRGLVHLSQDQPGAALADLDTALELQPDAPPKKLSRLLYNRGLARWLLYDVDGAFEDASAAIDADPSYALPFALRGRAAAQRGDLRRALEDLSEALRLDPEAANAEDTRCLRASTRADLGDLEGALDELARVLERDPSKGEAYDIRSRLWLLATDYTAAIADASRALELGVEPQTPLLQRRAVAYVQLRNLEPARADLDEALRLAPDQADLWLNRGQVRAMGGDLEDALADFDASLRLAPDLIEAVRCRALALAELGRTQEAIEAYTAVLRARPDQPSILVDRGRQWILAGDREAAAADLRRGLQTEGAGVATALWYALASGDLEALTPYAKGDDWGAALASHTVDRLSLEALLALAETAETEREREERRCQAQAYVALRLDMSGDATAARPHYEAALAATDSECAALRAWIRTRLSQ
jgi:tetratricopeptide (TPR) repeat protein